MLGRCILPAILSLALTLLPHPLFAAWFMRGDTNGSGTLTVSDPIVILHFLFSGGPAPSCLDAADVDDDGQVALNDPIFLLGYLFRGGEAPVARFGGCWFDTTEDELGCESHQACNPVAVFLTLQKSGSVNDGKTFAGIRREALDAIAQLSPQDQFGFCFFDAGLSRFPASDDPAYATPDQIANAQAVIQSTFPGYGTCAKPALLRALTYAERSTAKTKIIVHVSNGFNTCPGPADVVTYGNQILDEVRARNTGRVPIHAVAIGYDVNAEFMGKLASQNGGTLVRVVP